MTIGKYGMLSEDIPEGTQEQPVSEPVPDRKAEQPSGRDREGSTGEDGQPDGETVEEPFGTGQGSRPDGVDSTYERTDGNSGREHLDGIGIQLVEDTREDGLSKAEEEIASALSLPEYPTANEQKRQIGERVAAFYAGEIPIPESVVDDILRTGGNRTGSQLRIIYNFMSEQSPGEYTEFVKREYRKRRQRFSDGWKGVFRLFDETDADRSRVHTVADQILDKAFILERCQQTYPSAFKSGRICPAVGIGCGKDKRIEGTRTGTCLYERGYGRRCGRDCL